MSQESRSGISTIAKRLRQAQDLLEVCIAELEGLAGPRLAASKSRNSSLPLSVRDFDFESNERNFVKTHARGLSGPKKFVLLLAFLVKGKLGAEVELKEIEKHWNRMTGLLGGKFNRFYSNSAKDNGWVNSKKQGVYVLTPKWQKALGSSQ